eukprot:15720172-Heterocapsa_arctica.AAC.1
MNNIQTRSTTVKNNQQPSNTSNTLRAHSPQGPPRSPERRSGGRRAGDPLIGSPSPARPRESARDLGDPADCQRAEAV